jgi:monolysocardiolipin acyltransferase
MIHQAADKTMRYFKWGVARLILEPPECPDVVPMFIEGTDHVMHESRTFPRFLPRIGNKISVTFGAELDVEAVFGDLRKRWRDLADEHAREVGLSGWDETTLGLVPENLANHPEAVKLRKECTKRVRDAVLEVRRSRGLPDEDPKNGVVETWMREGPKREGLMDDGTWVKDT